MNIGWLRDARVEQHNFSDIQLANMSSFREMYATGVDFSLILSGLDIPPGTEVDCAYCGGTGSVMNTATGTLQDCPITGGTGKISY